MNGQPILTQRIHTIKLEDLPHTILLKGATDAGHLQIVQELSLHHNIMWQDITKNLSLDTINEISTCPEHCIYCIWTDEITEKEQNIILKFLEEPPENAWLMLLTTQTDLLLATIVNRCIVWEMEKYSREFLSKLTTDDLVLKYAQTPIQIEKYSKINIKEMYDFSKSVVTNISRARFSNCLVITSKVAFDDVKPGYPVRLFLTMLSDNAFEMVKYSTGNLYDISSLIKISSIIRGTLNDMIRFPLINKEWLFDNMLLKLKQIPTGGV